MSFGKINTATGIEVSWLTEEGTPHCASFLHPACLPGLLEILCSSKHTQDQISPFLGAELGKPRKRLSRWQQQDSNQRINSLHVAFTPGPSQPLARTL